MKVLVAAALTAALAAVLATGLAAGSLALAQGTGHGGHGAAQGAADQSPSTQAYRAAAEKMHRDMDIDYSGDSDVDFARGMIEHHRGAIAMAKVELEHGRDPEMRRLAEDIIAAQEAEIAWMKAWLQKRGR